MLWSARDYHRGHKLQRPAMRFRRQAKGALVHADKWSAKGKRKGHLVGLVAASGREVGSERLCAACGSFVPSVLWQLEGCMRDMLAIYTNGMDGK